MADLAKVDSNYWSNNWNDFAGSIASRLPDALLNPDAQALKQQYLGGLRQPAPAVQASAPAVSPDVVPVSSHQSEAPLRYTGPKNPTPAPPLTQSEMQQYQIHGTNGVTVVPMRTDAEPQLPKDPGEARRAAAAQQGLKVVNGDRVVTVAQGGGGGLRGGGGGGNIETPFINGVRLDNPGSPWLTGDPTHDKIAIDAYRAVNDAQEKLVQGYATKDLSQMRLNDSSANLHNVQAAELPKENASQAGLRLAQAEQARGAASHYTAQAADSKILRLKVPSGDYNQLGEPVYTDVAVKPDGTVINPLSSGIRPKNAVTPAPTAALDVLLKNKKDPKIVSAFQQKYGYLPDGL